MVYMIVILGFEFVQMSQGSTFSNGCCLLVPDTQNTFRDGSHSLGCFFCLYNYTLWLVVLSFRKVICYVWLCFPYLPYSCSDASKQNFGTLNFNRNNLYDFQRYIEDHRIYDCYTQFYIPPDVPRYSTFSNLCYLLVPDAQNTFRNTSHPLGSFLCLYNYILRLVDLSFRQAICYIWLYFPYLAYSYSDAFKQILEH